MKKFNAITFLGFLSFLSSANLQAMQQNNAQSNDIQAAIQGIKSSDLTVIDFALKSWELLFEKGQGFQEAIQLAKSSDLKYCEKCGLLTILVKNGQGFNLAIKAATLGNNDCLCCSLHLWKALVKQGLGFDEAIKIAEFGLKSEDPEDFEEKMLALDLWTALVEKGQCFDKAINVASYWIQNGYERESVKLFKALVKKGQGFDAAIKAVDQGIKSEDAWRIDASLKLLKTLVENGQGFDLAIKAASKGLKNKDWSLGGVNNYCDGIDLVQVHSIKIFKALFEKGQGFDAAINTIYDGINQHEISYIHASIKLFEVLIYQIRSLASSHNTPQNIEILWQRIIDTGNDIEGLWNQGVGLIIPNESRQIVAQTVLELQEKLSTHQNSLIM